MLVSVVIPTWKRAAILRETLDSLAQQRPKTGDGLEVPVGFEVIVVSDGEDAGTRELARSYAAIPVEWVFHERNQGQATARNTGAARARGELLLFLDDDTPAAPGLVELHAQAHACAQSSEGSEGEARVAVCGRIVESALAKPGSRTAQLLEKMWTETLEQFEATRQAEETDRIPPDAASMACFGLNCSIRRELFEQAGGFNPALRDMDEEMELGCRLYMRGVRFASEPRAAVYHRNDKDLLDYYLRCWRLGGSDDVLRAVKLGEHNEQTRQLLGMDRGPRISRMANRAFWHANAAARGVAAILRGVTEWSGWRGSFRLWQETTRVQRYWEAVRESGVGRDELRALAGNPARILMLHTIAPPQSAEEASYYLSPEHWRGLLETMKAEGYSCADPLKLAQPDAKWGERELVLTFDDGYDDFYTEVFPLIESYGLKPIVFLVAERIGDENRWDQAIGLRARRLMDAAQIRELQRHGVRFGSHTLTHPSLPKIGAAQLRRELADSKHKLEDLLGEEVGTFAYPYGDATRRVRAAVIEAGYKLAFTTVEGLNVWQDPFALLRTDICDLVPPKYFRWKLRHGVGPRRSVKDELMPVFQRMPRELRAPIEKAWKRRGSKS